MYQRDGWGNPDIFSALLRIRRPSAACYVDFGRIFTSMVGGDGQNLSASSGTWSCIFRFGRRCACVLCRQNPANKR